MKQGPIILIEDDVDDRDLFTDILKDLQVKNTCLTFKDCISAYEYFTTTTDNPFIIFCDINLPIENGLELKRKIDHTPSLRRKSIPFVFYSTAVDQDCVNEAYIQLTIQGFFSKSDNYPQAKATIKLILDYWNLCSHPSVS